jgi:hypothetical protein
MTKEAYLALLDETISLGESAHTYMTVIYAFMWLTLLYLLKNIAEKYYAMSRRKKSTILTLEYIVNIAGLILFIVWTFKHFNEWEVINIENLDPKYINTQ